MLLGEAFEVFDYDARPRSDWPLFRPLHEHACLCLCLFLSRSLSRTTPTCKRSRRRAWIAAPAPKMLPAEHDSSLSQSLSLCLHPAPP
jgi:hypothetical protein